MTTLGQLLRKHREKYHISQEALGDILGVQKQVVSNIETSKRSPTIQQLINIFNFIKIKDDHIGMWSALYLQTQLNLFNRNKNISSNLRFLVKQYIDVIDNYIKIYHHADQFDPQSSSLANFSTAFNPLTVICGDRREVPPKTKGDLFAFNVSITDLLHFPALEHKGNETKIKSDKILVNMDNTYLENEFGNSHLLVIGSPAVNFFTRYINNKSIFRFNLDPKLDSWMETFLQTKHINQRRSIEAFLFIVNNIDTNYTTNKQFTEIIERNNITKNELDHLEKAAETLLCGDSLKSLNNRFKKAGFFDPADWKIHGTTRNYDKDFGIISLAPNPFSRERNKYYSIIVAGTSGPGTATGLRILADNNAFSEHPLGGVFEVFIEQNINWPERMDNTNWSWQTEKYDRDKIIRNYKTHLLEKNFEKSSEDIKIDVNDVRAIIKIIEMF